MWRHNSTKVQEVIFKVDVLSRVEMCNSKWISAYNCVQLTKFNFDVTFISYPS